MKRLIIFDLDGTLLNTIADLGTSTNFALNHLGFPTHDIPSYKDRVGNGIAKMIERALPEGEKSEENINNVKKVFLTHYDEHKTDNTQPYEGIIELVNELQEKGIKMAVASNKYISAAQQIVSHFFPTIDFISVLGQRDGVATKPDPIIVYDILSEAEQFCHRYANCQKCCCRSMWSYVGILFSFQNRGKSSSTRSRQHGRTTEDYSEIIHS